MSMSVCCEQCWRVWMVCWLVECFFFFQAEDGIRDTSVTGVQSVLFRSVSQFGSGPDVYGAVTADHSLIRDPTGATVTDRSEERRVGKEGTHRGAAGRLRKHGTSRDVTRERRRR